MSDDQELSEKLRRLGVVKGARHLKPAPPPDPSLLQRRSPAAPISASNQPDHIQSLSTLLPGGYFEETAVGNCFIVDNVFPLHHSHGNETIGAILDHHPQETVPLTADTRFEPLDFRNFLFLDTETTGLAGAGTIAFMVGVAYFEGDALITRQYFVPDFGDEAAMLSLLDNLLADKTALITFNGRTFDVPLLDGRYLMNRLFSELRDRPHLDLLPPARRLWRNRLESVALSNLETHILGLQRSQEDVPGWLIPSLYMQYVRSGDARELLRVFYHNRLDLLSMVTLTKHLLRQFYQPQAGDHPLDLYSLGRWQAHLGQIEPAETNLRLAAQGDLPLTFFHQTLQELGLLLKRNGRRREAVPIWQQIAATSFEEVDAHIELAKHYEWQEKDISLALDWTEQAIQLTAGWPPSKAALVLDELHHRRQRLQQKIDK